MLQEEEELSEAGQWTCGMCGLTKRFSDSAWDVGLPRAVCSSCLKKVENG